MFLTKNRKLIILITVSLILLGGFFYLLYITSPGNQPNENEETPVEEFLDITQREIENEFQKQEEEARKNEIENKQDKLAPEYKTFNHSSLDFTFEYPSNWVIKQDFEDNYINEIILEDVEKNITINMEIVSADYTYENICLRSDRPARASCELDLPQEYPFVGVEFEEFTRRQDRVLLISKTGTTTIVYSPTIKSMAYRKELMREGFNGLILEQTTYTTLLNKATNDITAYKLPNGSSLRISYAFNEKEVVDNWEDVYKIVLKRIVSSIQAKETE
jgi:hypothetical protein